MLKWEICNLQEMFAGEAEGEADLTEELYLHLKHTPGENSPPHNTLTTPWSSSHPLQVKVLLRLDVSMDLHQECDGHGDAQQCDLHCGTPEGEKTDWTKTAGAGWSQDTELHPLGEPANQRRGRAQTKSLFRGRWKNKDSCVFTYMQVQKFVHPETKWRSERFILFFISFNFQKYLYKIFLFLPSFSFWSQ